MADMVQITRKKTADTTGYIRPAGSTPALVPSLILAFRQWFQPEVKKNFGSQANHGG